MAPVMVVVLLMLGSFRELSDAQVTGEDADGAPGPPGGDGGAFFALRSCHQLLSGDEGEFFSPDYLCSNPPLWCNWTIQVHPGKRIHLELEDFTPDDACHLKQDQIHVDEPAGRSLGHRVLQRCWREAKYASASNTLYVVLLIGGWHSPPYRGFFGRYRAFGPPVVYKPQYGVADRSGNPSAGGVMRGEQVDPDLPERPSAANSDRVRGSGDAEVSDPSVPLLTAVPASTQRTYRSGRGVSLSPRNRSGSDAASAPQKRVAPDHELGPDSQPELTNVGEAPGVETNTLSWRGGRSQDGPEPDGAEQARPRTNMVELLSERRGSPGVRNRSESPHLPGDFLFEVAVEVDFSQDLEDSWDSQARSLLLPVKSLIRDRLEAAQPLLSVSSKRVKRLNAGVLYILWLQIARGPTGPRLHGSVHSALQGLVSAGLGLREAVIISVSTADVNECGTQLLLCDINADCVNHFGSYSCHCRPGFRDESRLGSGGSVCVDVRGCSSGLSPEAKGVYVLFFLLSSLMLILLVVAGVVYRRHHRGAFMVRSSSSSPDLNNNHHHHHHHDDDYSYPTEADLPPPLPPARGPRGGWPQGKERCPAVDLPLLRFSSLLPSDGYLESQEGGRT